MTAIASLLSSTAAMPAPMPVGAAPPSLATFLDLLAPAAGAAVPDERQAGAEGGKPLPEHDSDEDALAWLGVVPLPSIALAAPACVALPSTDGIGPQAVGAVSPAGTPLRLGLSAPSPAEPLVAPVAVPLPGSDGLGVQASAGVSAPLRSDAGSAQVEASDNELSPRVGSAVPATIGVAMASHVVAGAVRAGTIGRGPGELLATFAGLSEVQAAQAAALPSDLALGTERPRVDNDPPSPTRPAVAPAEVSLPGADGAAIVTPAAASMTAVRFLVDPRDVTASTGLAAAATARDPGVITPVTTDATGRVLVASGEQVVVMAPIAPTLPTKPHPDRLVPAGAADKPLSRRGVMAGSEPDRRVPVNTLIPLTGRAETLPAATVAPAARVFAEAIQRAFDDKAQATDPASSTPIAAAPIAHVVATGAAQGGTLDMRHGSWPAAMIERIVQLRDMTAENDTRLRLSPDMLGTIDVSLKRDGDQVQVQIIAEHAQTRHLLADAQPRLIELAEARGVKLQLAGGQAGGGGLGSQGGGDASRHHSSTPAPTHRRTAAPADAGSTDQRIA